MTRLGFPMKDEVGRSRSNSGAALRAAWLLAVLGLAAAQAAAQETNDFDPFHWAYSAAFGSGVYRLDDGTEARALRVTSSFWIRKSAIRRGPNFGLRLLLPISVGAQALNPEELPPGRDEDEIQHVAIPSGVEIAAPGKRRCVRTGT